MNDAHLNLSPWEQMLSRRKKSYVRSRTRWKALIWRLNHAKFIHAHLSFISSYFRSTGDFIWKWNKNLSPWEQMLSRRKKSYVRSRTRWKVVKWRLNHANFIHAHFSFISNYFRSTSDFIYKWNKINFQNSHSKC